MSEKLVMSFHRMESCVFTIDRRQVTNFDEGDDVFQIEWGSDIGEPLVGADGCAIVSVLADQSVTITLRLMQTSPFNAFLSNKVKAMRAGSLRTFPVSFTDSISGESGSCNECVIIAQPGTQKGARATSREWRIFAPVWAVNQVTYQG